MQIALDVPRDLTRSLEHDQALLDHRAIVACVALDLILAAMEEVVANPSHGLQQLLAHAAAAERRLWREHRDATLHDFAVWWVTDEQINGALQLTGTVQVRFERGRSIFAELVPVRLRAVALVALAVALHPLQRELKPSENKHELKGKSIGHAHWSVPQGAFASVLRPSANAFGSVSTNSVFASPVPADESYGALPLMLLRAIDQAEDAPPEILKIAAQARIRTHSRLIAASTRSEMIDVADASHDIHLDQPEQVAAAVARLIASLSAADELSARDEAR